MTASLALKTSEYTAVASLAQICVKEGRGATLKTSLSGQNVSALLLTDFGESLVQHPNISQLAARR